MTKAHIIRSMFIRRLLLLGGAFAIGLGALLIQACRLTVVQGPDLLDDAEARLLRDRWTPTVRGRVLDRKGRILAYDRPAFDVMIEYPLITGEWAYSAAAEEAREADPEQWGTLDKTQRDELIRSYLPEYERREAYLWANLAVILDIPVEDLEQRRDEIEQTVERMAEVVWNARLRQRRAELNRDREQAVEVTLADVAQPLREQTEPHAIAVGIDEETAFAVRRLAAQFDGVSLAQGGWRDYPYDSITVDIDRSTFPPPIRADAVESRTVSGVTSHVVGRMRKLFREDVETRPRINPDTGETDRGHYRHGDRVGASGVESALEGSLRGLRGHIITHRDTGKEEVIAPVPGTDARLTLDIMLQARVQAVLSPDLGLAQVQDWHATRAGLPAPLGTELNAAAVVLDVDTGEILAMVSTPTYTREQLQEDFQSINDPVAVPLVNRAVARPYMPGSIVKPLMLAGALTDGMIHLDTGIECTGHYYPEHNNRFRCWIYRPYYGNTTHHEQFGRPLLGDEAICVSCNIFFYTLGNQLGPDGVVRWYKRFGMEEPFDLGIGAEYHGNAGRKVNGDPLYIGDAMLMAIGQGPVAWTPLHAADSYATLARGGLRVTPRILADAPPRARDLHLDPESVDLAMRGLKLAANDELGTGSSIAYASGSEPIFDVPGVEVWGKTGTATAVSLLGEDPDGDGPEPRPVLRKGDHSWYVVLAGREGLQPRYAIAVIIEYGGSGGRVAGPVTEQIIYALVAEGYL